MYMLCSTHIEQRYVVLPNTRFAAQALSQRAFQGQAEQHT